MPKVNMDRVRGELAKAQAKADKRGIMWWKPKEGENIIRILPPWSTEGVFAKEAGYHYNVAQDSAVACPKVCKGEPCPICETVTELFRGRKPEDITLAKRIGVKVRYFYNIVDRVAKDGKVYVYGSGVKVYESLLSIFGDKDYGDITDVEKGYDVKLIRKGEGIDTEYEVRPVKNPSAVIKWDEKKKKLVDLDSIPESDLMSYAKLKALLEGTNPDEAEEEEKPKAVAKTKPAPAPKKAVEEEEEAPAEEAEEEAPKAEKKEVEEEEAPAAEEAEESEEAEPAKKEEDDEEVNATLERLRKMKKTGK